MPLIAPVVGPRRAAAAEYCIALAEPGKIV
jgi:hypothetical protein